MSAEETHVRFGVFDFGPDASVVTAALGIRPTKAWSVGDPIPGSMKRRAHSRWEIASPVPSSGLLKEQLDALLDLLELHRGAVQEARERFGAGILCALYTASTNPGFHLSEHALSRVAALGLSIDFDLYCLRPASEAADEADVRPES